MISRPAATAARPTPYRFDEVFALDVHGESRDPAADPSGHDSAIEAARREGYESGLAEGRRGAAQELDTRLADSARQLFERVAALTSDAAAERRQVHEEAIGLALAAARKLAPALMAREPTAELEALLRRCLGDLREAPHLVVRVAPELADAMRERIEGLSREAGFTGHMVVLGDPDIAPGDGRVDWADGGIVRERATLEAALDEAVASYLVAAGTEEAKDANHG